MFGNRDGFDAVIGNPPYVQLQKDGGKLGRLYKDSGYKTFAGTGDIYQLFYERGCQLLAPQRGMLAYITSNSWLKAEYGKTMRRYFSEQHTPLRLLEMGKDVFENAIVDTSILMSTRGQGRSYRLGGGYGKSCPTGTFRPVDSLWGPFHPQDEKPWAALSATERCIMDKMESCRNAAERLGYSH